MQIRNLMTGDQENASNMILQPGKKSDISAPIKVKRLKDISQTHDLMVSNVLESNLEQLLLVYSCRMKDWEYYMN